MYAFESCKLPVREREQTGRENKNFQCEFILCTENLYKYEIPIRGEAVRNLCGLQCTAYTIRFSFVRLSVQWIVRRWQRFLFGRRQTGATMGPFISCTQSRSHDWRLCMKINDNQNRAIESIFHSFFFFIRLTSLGELCLEMVGERYRKGDISDIIHKFTAN